MPKKKNVPMGDKKPCPRCSRLSIVVARGGKWCFFCTANIKGRLRRAIDGMERDGMLSRGAETPRQEQPE